MRDLHPFRLSVVRTAIAFLLVAPFVSVAQDVTESALKAGFMYNFVRFTEWPDALPAVEPFVMCVVGDSAVGEALERVVKGRELAGHRIVVSTAVGAPAAVLAAKPTCHVLYVSGVSSGQAAKVIGAFRDAPVLTISDIEGFGEAGGIVQFFFEHGQLRFNIRPESAKRARLRISARLLMLSRTI